jgi:hypothetical protein
VQADERIGATVAVEDKLRRNGHARGWCRVSNLAPFVVCLCPGAERRSSWGASATRLATRRLCLQILENPVLRPSNRTPGAGQAHPVHCTVMPTTPVVQAGAGGDRLSITTMSVSHPRHESYSVHRRPCRWSG